MYWGRAEAATTAAERRRNAACMVGEDVVQTQEVNWMKLQEELMTFHIEGRVFIYFLLNS